MSKLTWSKDDFDYYYHSSNLGSANIEEVSPGKWRWEAHSSNEMQMFDMDCWWGTDPSLEEAQLSAEQELLRWPLDSEVKK
jgi:hypothetical protein